MAQPTPHKTLSRSDLLPLLKDIDITDDLATFVFLAIIEEQMNEPAAAKLIVRGTAAATEKLSKNFLVHHGDRFWGPRLEENRERLVEGMNALWKKVREVHFPEEISEHKKTVEIAEQNKKIKEVRKGVEGLDMEDEDLGEDISGREEVEELLD